MTAKSPYKKDNKSYTRRVKFEDRVGKQDITVFEKDYQNSIDENGYSCFGSLERGMNNLRPVCALKCKVNEYIGRRSLMLDKILFWYNKKEIIQRITDLKQQELQAVKDKND